MGVRRHISGFIGGNSFEVIFAILETVDVMAPVARSINSNPFSKDSIASIEDAITVLIIK